MLEMIHQDYMNDISLESCADRAGTNSYTLSKAFKQVTGINLSTMLPGSESKSERAAS
ncbi:helix-turn-helix transcriptional regulator [Bacillus licheniformis]|nr:helix-turn-helix transcriptional regulator [Bacillus licheniformis]